MKAYKTDGFLSRTLANWACRLTYEDLSTAAVERAKLFWFDSLGCALGGSQQEDARILMDHHRAMWGEAGNGGGNGDGPSPRSPSGRTFPLPKGEEAEGTASPISQGTSSSLPSAQCLVPSASSSVPGASASCFVCGCKTNPVDAALLNSHMMRAMDYNDIYWKADPCHPSDLICGPLALVEAGGLSGKDLILATVIAYEVEMRLAEAGRPGIREYGWHHATLTAFAAPIAAGRVLGLTPEQMVNAIGICASRTCSLGAVTAGKLTNMKNTVDPWATRMGVESALLAQRGFSGPEHIFDGKEGLFHVFGHSHHDGKPCTFDEETLVGALPECGKCHYKIIDCGMKSFPIEALSHAPLTAMMKCVQENGIKADDVTEIKVEVIARAADILGDPHKYRPTGKETADHSLPYSLAVGLIDGMVTPLQFEQSRIDDRGLEPVMDMVKVVPNEEFEALFPEFQPSRVTVTLKDGSSHTKRVDVPKGDPRDPMTEDEIAVKFHALGDAIVGADRCDEIQTCIMGLENESGVGRLMDLMTARS